jgi:threonylcarbamoyladenosine tRNA methylthiotransferase MtaB
MTPTTVAFHTLGCKLNYAETSSLQRMFEQAGFAVVPYEQAADIYVLNTCSVTDFADQKCRHAVRKALRANPQARMIVVGCYAQLKPTEIAAIEGVDLVLGAAEKFRILEFVEGLAQATGKGMVQAGEVKAANTFHAAFSFGDRTRSFLKVQDGCDYKCTFCTIPLARGASRSDTAELVLANARTLADQGVQEIVLTGVNLGDFGNGTAVIEGTKPRKEALFSDLVQALDTQAAVPRYRISSIEPNLLTQELIDFVAHARCFMPHFHIPLQSGNNKQLADMRRRYRRELYADRVTAIKTAMPHACIGVDVIVGFPGETDEDFLETVAFIDSLPVSYLHVFTYSERPNTPAADMGGAVPMHTRRKRNDVLRQLSAVKKQAFYKEHEKTTRLVLFEKDDDGFLTGFSDNYIKIRIPSEQAEVNTIAPVGLNSLLPDGRMEASRLTVMA